MNIVLDGLSGVGKSYYGRLLAEKHNMSFVEFEPDLNNPNELAEHEQIIWRHGCTNLIIENSITMAELVKLWMYSVNYISFKDLVYMLSSSKTRVQPHIILFLHDTPESIAKKRIKRNRLSEYYVGLKDLSSVDAYILRNYVRRVRNEHVPFWTINIVNKSDDEVIKLIEEAVIDLI
jgi:shikimate kinase